MLAVAVAEARLVELRRAVPLEVVEMVWPHLLVVHLLPMLVVVVVVVEQHQEVQQVVQVVQVVVVLD